MGFHRWFRFSTYRNSLFRVPERGLFRQRRSARRFRLRLEALESRCVPSTFTVTNTGDNSGVNPSAGAGSGTLRQAIADANAANTGTVANPDQSPETWHIRQAKMPNTVFSEDHILEWGAAVLRTDDYLYVYGTDERRGKGFPNRQMVVDAARSMLPIPLAF